MTVTTYRRYECLLCPWVGRIFLGCMTQVWRDKLPEAHDELLQHFREEHGFTEDRIWPMLSGKYRVATGYLKDLEEE